MSVLRKIWDWLKSSRRENQRKWHPDLNPIDIQKISRELNLKSEAQRLGVAGVPSENAEKLSGPEASVVFRIDQARTNYMSWGGLRLGGLNDELSRRDITKDINQASRAYEEFERLAGAALTTRESTLRELGANARARKEELDRFKRDNNLERLPIVPQGNQKLLMIVVALALIAVEASLNMTFFAKGLSTGLLGGFTEAAIAAFMNVGMSFLSGVLLVRWVHHIRILPKLFGLLACAITMCFILAMALGIAHYRDALAMGSADAMSLALQTLLASPFTLTELSSWLLCFVSIAFGGFAVFDGYRIDDPYPGYGKKYRMADEIIQDYNGEIKELHEYLEDLKKDMLENLERVAKSSESSVSIYDTIIGTKRRSGQELAEAIQGAESALHALLQEFRDENCIARGDKPKPAYFNTWPELRKLEMQNFDTTADEANLASQRQLLSNFLGDLENIRALIQIAFTTRFNSLQTLHANFIPSSGAVATPSATVESPMQAVPLNRSAASDHSVPPNGIKQFNRGVE
jgi:hypothetical protein